MYPVLILYLAWIPLAMISAYLQYKAKLRKIPPNIKSRTRYAQIINRARNRERKLIKKELTDDFMICFIPVINIFITLFLFTPINKLK